jgi:hypothetical protein
MKDRIKPGDRVIYVPTHAKGDLNHPDSERGVVSSLNDTYVFVKYIRHGILQETSQATRYEDLYLEMI